MSTICPYTGNPATDMTTEHIFPDALGGSAAYCISASRQANSDLGTKIDAALINSQLIQALRLQHGIRSRSGEPEWRMRGTLKPSGTEAEITFKANGTVEQRIRKPVKTYEKDHATLVLGPDETKEFLDQFIAGQRKKGRQVLIAERHKELGFYEVDISIDLLAIKRAMAKISFAALYEFLGDKFLSDPLIAEWRKVIASSDREEVTYARIRGAAFLESPLLDVIMPDLQPHEHAVVIANLQQTGPVCAVTLFGKGFHNMVTIASESSNMGLGVGQGQVVVCNAKSKTIQKLDFFSEVLLKKSFDPAALNMYGL